MKASIFRRYLAFFLALMMFVFSTNLLTAAEMNDKFQRKFKEKIEQLIIRRVLGSIKEKDYDTYRVMKVLWEGIKIGSLRTVKLTLKQLLIEKGFIYMLYFRTKKYIYPYLTAFLHFIKTHEIFEKKYNFAFKFVEKTYGSWHSAVKKELGEYYRWDVLMNLQKEIFLNPKAFGKNPKPFGFNGLFYKVRRFQKFLYRTPGTITDSELEPVARRMMAQLINNPELVMTGKFVSGNVVQEKVFIKKLVKLARLYLIFNKYSKYYGTHKIQLKRNTLYAWYAKMLNGGYRSWMKELKINYLDLDKVYLEIVTYLVRMAMVQNKQEKGKRGVGNFTHLAKLLHRFDHRYPKNANSLKKIVKTAQKLSAYYKKRNPVRAVAWGGFQEIIHKVLMNTGDKIVDAYQSSNSFYGLMNAQNVRKYFIRIFDGKLFTRTAKQTLNPAEEKKTIRMLQLYAMIADYIVSGNTAKLSAAFKRYIVWNARKLIHPILRKSNLHQKYIGVLLLYFAGYYEFSQFIRWTSWYVGKATGKDFSDRQGMLLALQKALEKSPISRSYTLRLMVLKVAGELSKGPEADLLKLQKDLKAMLPLAAGEFFAVTKQRVLRKYLDPLLEYRIPFIGTSIRTFLTLIMHRNEKAFLRLITAAFRKTVLDNVKKLPPNVRRIVRPFLGLAMGFALYKREATMKQVAQIAMDVLQNLDKSSRAFYMSVGLSFGQFTEGSFGDLFKGGNAATGKLFLDDKLGLDLIGLAGDLSDQKDPSSLRFGPFIGGFLDYALSEGAGLDTRNQPGGRHYIRTGLFLALEPPGNDLMRFDISMGWAWSFDWKRAWFFGISWNILELSDLF